MNYNHNVSSRDSLEHEDPFRRKREQKFRLAAAVYYCCTDSGIVFLDLRTGKYFALPAASTSELREMIEGFPETIEQHGNCGNRVSSNLCESLIEQGFVTACYEVGSTKKPPTVQSVDSVLGPRRQSGDAISLRLVTNFFISLLYILWVHLLNTSHRHILALTESAHHKLEPRGPPTDGFLQRLMSSFFRLRMWFYTAREACLFDSLVLNHLLRRYGFSPMLVIGVAIKPFRAHAWIQIDELVLNDISENVKEYTPIFVVG